jgi:radical SAM superfamily enzyme YgiQ (UPF0313 family)
LSVSDDRFSVLLAVPYYAERISRVAQTTVGPPLGLGYLAAVLLERGVKVTILDANAERLSDRETVNRIVDAKPNVVGFSAVTPTVEQSGRILGQVKERLPDVVTVIGGVHATAVPEETLHRLPGIDIAVRGEAEFRFADLVERLAAKKKFEDIRGLAYRTGGRIVNTEPATDPHDLDALPFPARELLPMEKYVGPDGHAFTTIVGNRGCPGRCVYCSVHQVFGTGLRQRDPAGVVEEMAKCHELYGTRTFGFNDDTFTTNPAWVEALCDRLIETGLSEKVRWLCLTRVDRVKPELLAKMKRAGCFKVELGIESGAQEVLDALGKGTKTEQIVQAFKWAREAGLKTLAFVMLFSPAETESSLATTRDLIFRADPDLLQASFCTPYPGTALEAQCRANGIAIENDWEKFVFLTSPVMEHLHFSREQMLAWQSKLLRSFYFRPRTIWRMLAERLSEGGWLGFIRTAWIGASALLRRS